MLRRLGVVLAVAAVAVASVTALASARTTNAKTSLQVALSEIRDPMGNLVGSLRGDTVVPKQIYCEQKRKIEIFRDGQKIGSTESDRSGSWSFGLDPLESGTYVAKTKRILLPPSFKPNGNRVACGAAQSEPIVVP